jgi:hypothetical protein
MRVPESRDPIYTISIFIGSYVRCISDIFAVLA